MDVEIRALLGSAALYFLEMQEVRAATIRVQSHRTTVAPREAGRRGVWEHRAFPGFGLVRGHETVQYFELELVSWKFGVFSDRSNTIRAVVRNY